ncbi:hypothetical protein ACWGQ5_27830 [Streptomyces sp. NPDC055722]
MHGLPGQIAFFVAQLATAVTIWHDIVTGSSDHEPPGHDTCGQFVRRRGSQALWTASCRSASTGPSNAAVVW